MSGKTPGQACFEGYERAASGDPDLKVIPWEDVDPRGRRNWDAAAAAAVSAELDVPRCEKCGRYPIDHRGGACIYPRQGAELAARRTAAAAVLADYQRAAAEGADVADRALWAARLADMLSAVLAGLGAQVPTAAEQLEEIEALRDLIDAAAQCADVPIAAPGHLRQDDRLAWIRADTIRAYLRDIDYGAEYLCAVLAGKARALREQAAKPVTYEVYQPAQGAATAIVAEAIKTGTPVIVEDDFVQNRRADLDPNADEAQP